MSKVELAQNFARERHSKSARKEDVTLQHEHLTGVVARLKNLGISDDDVLSAAWLHDIINETATPFDELDKRFGSRVAVLVLGLSIDKNIARAIQEEQYVKQLRDSPFEVKLIKLCDISANLRDLKNTSISKTRKIKYIKKMRHHLNVIKPELDKKKSDVPGISSLINGINDVILSFGLKPVTL